MRLVKVAAAALNQTPLDWDHNLQNILGAIESAREAGVSLLCLPELCITGYGCEDAFLSPDTHRLALEVLHQILPSTRGLVVSVGLPVRHNKAVFNACALLVDGRPVGLVAKRALAGDGIHYEPRWFKPWPAGRRTRVALGPDSLPMGDIHFDVGGIKIGFEICEDAWTVERPGTELAARAVDVIFNPSASHFAFGKHEVRKRLVLEGSRAFGVSYVYANLVGNEAGRVIYDGDALIATDGAIAARARRFRYTEHAIVSAVVDVDLTRTRHGWRSSYHPEVSVSPDECVSVPFSFPRCAPEPVSSATEAWEGSSTLKEEELARAVPLALFDYLRKSRSRGFVVSLSGGCDSAAVACLVALMIRTAVSELGLAGVHKALGHIPDLESARAPEELTGRLLTTVYQAGEHSGAATREAARAIAQGLGARHLELDIRGQIAGYVHLAEQVLGRPLSWERDDIALQNVQARARAPSVWLLANVSGALLLSTSNRSEAAVGYATMDGDTAGGLAPIAGVDKAFLRRFLLWLERTGPEGLGPIPALSKVNQLTPTAELRPPAAAQTDEDDLMPYDVLDRVERAAIRDKRSPREILELLRVDYPDHELPRLAGWIRKFFQLFARNQWKRERYAPCFHLDDANLDPKTWCRFPILSGGFLRELKELDAIIGER